MTPTSLMQHENNGKKYLLVYDQQSSEQGRIQACFDNVQPLWPPKKTVQIFLQAQINNRIFR